jgi:predicted phosphodiesterase
MRKLLVSLLTVGVLTVAVVLSNAQTDRPYDNGAGSRFVVTSENKNPWTSLAPNVAADQFQFAIVSDRTGGHREGVFSKAVQKVNLMQPEFVMSVGDLIEGSREEAVNRTQWADFDRYARQFEMPFFYCVGNHDGDNRVKAAVWQERLGRPYYHFTYQNCLFLILNSNDPAVAPDAQEGGLRTGIGKEQRTYVEKTLTENNKVRWTFVFLHHPVWAGSQVTENGWQEVEKLLADRKYNVFCGHVHIFRKFIRNGMSYYQLATTGGSSSMRGVEYGEFDQIAWVTMKKNGPVIAQLGLDGVMKDDLSAIVSTEDGNRPPSSDGLNEVVGTVTLNGQPVAGLQVQFVEIGAPPAGRGNQTRGGVGLVGADGKFKVYDNRGPAGLRAAQYSVTVVPARGLIVDGMRPENPVPEKYRSATTTPFRVEVKVDMRNKFEFNLEAK